ncbi:MAG TPA: hypothetical protein VM074_09495 [Solimonas sp.]|nr:hypothetical protein [Solimonas sp.]
MGNMTVFAAVGLSVAMSTAALILARRTCAASAAGAYAIRSEAAITRERWRLQASLWMGLVAVLASGATAVRTSTQADQLNRQVLGLETRLQARVVVQVPPALPAPAPVAEAAPPPAHPPRIEERAPRSSAPERAAPPEPAAAFAVVSMPGRGKLIVRDAPGGHVLGAIADGSRLVVLDRNTRTVDGRSWSRVRATSGSIKGLIQGWAASEFIAEGQAVAQR